MGVIQHVMKKDKPRGLHCPKNSSIGDEMMKWPDREFARFLRETLPRVSKHMTSQGFDARTEPRHGAWIGLDSLNESCFM